MAATVLLLVRLAKTIQPQVGSKQNKTPRNWGAAGLEERPGRSNQSLVSQVSKNKGPSKFLGFGDFPSARRKIHKPSENTHTHTYCHLLIKFSFGDVSK